MTRAVFLTWHLTYCRIKVRHGERKVWQWIAFLKEFLKIETRCMQGSVNSHTLPTTGICGDFEIWVSKMHKMPHLWGIVWLTPPGKPPHHKQGYVGTCKLAISGLQNPQKASTSLRHIVCPDNPVVSPTPPCRPYIDSHINDKLKLNVVQNGYRMPNPQECLIFWMGCFTVPTYYDIMHAFPHFQNVCIV